MVSAKGPHSTARLFGLRHTVMSTLYFVQLYGITTSVQTQNYGHQTCFRSLSHDNMRSENSSRPDELGKLALALQADDGVAPTNMLLVCTTIVKDCRETRVTRLHALMKMFGTERWPVFSCR